MQRPTRWLWILVTATVGVGLPLWWTRATAAPKAPAASRQVVRKVRTAVVEQRPLEAVWEGHGLVRAGDRAALAFTLSGRLAARPVQVGDRVQRGQLLARLDARAYRHAAQAARAELDRATTQREQYGVDAARLDQLGEANAVPREQVERIHSALRGAQAAEQAARVQRDESERALSETVLRAPFDAVVAAVALEPGELAAPGEPVVVLSGRGLREVEIEVPVATAQRIDVGAGAEVHFPLSETRTSVPAVVQSVGAAARRQAGLMPVVVAIEAAHDQAVPGAAARVRIPVAQPSRLSVPAAAIVDPSGDAPCVLRVKDAVVEKVPVRVHELVATRVWIEAALSAGDAVVVSGTAALRAGDAVETLP